MKATRSSLDQHLELSVYADDQKLQEYVLYDDDKVNRNILECFVPVREGQKLTLKGKFEGNCVQASFDLVVDGSFLQDARLEDTGGSQRRKRQLHFERVYDCPAEKEGWTSKEPPIDVYEARLYVEELGDLVRLEDVETMDWSGVRPGVGSIQVVAHLQDFEGEQRFDPEWDIHGGGWLRRHKNPVRPSGIEADCAIEVRHVSDEKVQQKRSRIHRNHGLVDTRYGIVPWARFVFYYRKQESIAAAKCLLRNDEVRELDTQEENVASPLREDEAYQGDEAEAVVPQRVEDTSWENQAPFSTTDLPKLSKLGGDFGSLLPPQPKSLRQARDRRAREATTSEAELFGDEVGDDTASQEDSLFVEEFSPPPKDRHNRKDLTATPSLHHASLTAIPTTNRSPSTAFHTSTSPFSRNMVGSRTATPNPNDMATLDLYLPNLPSLDDLANLIGIYGSTSLETSKYFGKIAKENGFPANGSVRNKLKSEYNLLIKKVAHVDTTTDKVTLREKYMPSVIKQEDHDRRDTIAAMPKQQHSRHNKPPPAPMVARSIEKPRSSMPSPAVSERTNVLKRPASKSSTPDTIAKKAKLVVENTPEVEAARARIEEQRKITAQLTKQYEEKQAKKAAKKAQRAAEKQKEAEELEKQQAVEANAKEIEILAEEERTQQAQIDALKAVAGDDDDEDEDEDSEEDETFDENMPAAASPGQYNIDDLNFDSFMPTGAAGELQSPELGREDEVKMDAKSSAEAEVESEED